MNASDLINRLVAKSLAALDRRREIECLKILAYLGTVPMVLYYDADGNLLPAKI